MYHGNFQKKYVAQNIGRISGLDIVARCSLLVACRLSLVACRLLLPVASRAFPVAPPLCFFLGLLGLLEDIGADCCSLGSFLQGISSPLEVTLVKGFYDW